MTELHNLFGIKVQLLNGIWTSPFSYQRDAMTNFLNGFYGLEKDIEYYDKDNITFQIKRFQKISSSPPSSQRNAYNPIYLYRENGSKMPIVDFDNVKICDFTIPRVNHNIWHNARLYQSWAYYDYLYKSTTSTDPNYKIGYKSPGTLSHPDYITIPEQYMKGVTMFENYNFPNIIFTISRNSNGSVYYQKNDEALTKIRICDSKKTRRNYKAYINRITSYWEYQQHQPQQHQPQQHQHTSVVKLPDNIVVTKTDDEELQCNICYTNQMNIVLHPCKHTLMCSECYIENYKKGRKCCPYCKQNITNITKLV